MKTSLKLMGAALLGAAVVTATAFASRPGGEPEPMFATLYFSDASYSTVVGSVSDICFAWGVAQGPLNGQATAFSRTISTGYCLDGVMVIM